MRGARGDAARRAEAAQATTSQSAFGDYVRFDEMFGASCIFTAGDPVQVQRQREAYVKDTMTRKLYGYVHSLETHGAPIQRVVVGGGCEAAENRGGFPTSRPRHETGGAHAVDALAKGDPLASRKRARVEGSAGGRTRGISPAARGGVAPHGGARAFDSPGARLGNEVSLANLFEPNLGEDLDPLWAAMDSFATLGSVGGLGGPLEDPSALLPGALNRGAATEEELMRRVRIELIEERLHSLEHALASARVPKRSDPAAGAAGSGDGDKSDACVRLRGGSGGDDACAPADCRDVVARAPATNLFESGLSVDTRRRGKRRRSSGDASDKSGGGGKDPQSPSPLRRSPPNPSRSRSQSDGRGVAHERGRWIEAGDFRCGSEKTPLVTSGGEAPSAEFPVATPRARADPPGVGGHKVSTSFTSTPGGGRADRADRADRDFGMGLSDAEGESPRATARRLARENAALAEERRRANRERDVLLAEHEHNKAQAALLQASNARYERRVAQLEALVREQTADERDGARVGALESGGAFGDGFETGARCAPAAQAGREGASFPDDAATAVAEDVAEKTSSGVEGVMPG